MPALATASAATVPAAGPTPHWMVRVGAEAPEARLARVQATEVLPGEQLQPVREALWKLTPVVGAEVIDCTAIQLLPRQADRPAPSAEARIAHLEGLHFANQRGEEGLRRAIEMYEQAMAAAPGYAAARAGEAIAELQKPHTLDPVSAIVHTHLGIAHMYARRYSEAVSFYDQALQLCSPTG